MPTSLGMLLLGGKPSRTEWLDIAVKRNSSRSQSVSVITNVRYAGVRGSKSSYSLCLVDLGEGGTGVGVKPSDSLRGMWMDGRRA